VRLTIEGAAGRSATSGPPSPLQAETPRAAQLPRLAPQVELLGELQASGFKDRQWLIRRGDRFVQVTELLYRVAERATGQHTLDDIAAAVTESTEWIVGPEHVRQLILTRLLPLGLIAQVEGPAAVHADAAPSPLGVNMRVKVIGPNLVDPVARTLRFLFAPPILLPLLAATALAHGWVYFAKDVTSSIEDVIYTPWLLLVQVGLMLVGGAFHELGHAAALRHAGGRVRGMGVGFYLLYPAFYTDVTESYRFGRWARLRTDLGGVYFNLLFALGLVGLYLVSGQEFLLAAVLLADLDAVRQFLPFGRLDGYWALADLTGIPDFFSQAAPFLRSLAPSAQGAGGRLPRLKRWVSVVFAAYLLVSLPILGLLFLLTIAGLPTFLAMTWDSFQMQTASLLGALGEGDLPVVLASATQIGMLALPVLASAFLLYSLGWEPGRALWRWSQPTRRRCAVGVFATSGFVAIVALLWAPQLIPMAATEPEGAPDGVQSFPGQQRLHVQTQVVYAQNPPVGGRHAPVWQNCGFYTTPVRNENAVHSLEHGAVWITYAPDLPPDQVEALRAFTRGPRSYVIVSPYDGLPAPVVASAWGYQLQLTSADDPRLDQFVRAFRLGPQAPERDAPCAGGVGQPEP
jgi:putative peptide zinc metalloprotease protein